MRRGADYESFNRQQAPRRSIRCPGRVAGKGHPPWRLVAEACVRGARETARRVSKRRTLSWIRPGSANGRRHRRRGDSWPQRDGTAGGRVCGGGDIDGFGGGVRVDALGVGGGLPHPVAAVALGGGRHIAVEPRDARDDKLAAVSLVDDIAEATTDREEERAVSGEGELRTGHCGAGADGSGRCKVRDERPGVAGRRVRHPSTRGGDFILRSKFGDGSGVIRRRFMPPLYKRGSLIRLDGIGIILPKRRHRTTEHSTR